jgi:hypothetical protein
MSVNIFIPSTKKNSGSAASQEDVEFVIWKNPKNGNEYQLLNLENDNLAPRSGIVEVKPLKVTKRHDNNVNFRILSDKPTGYLIGIPIAFDHESGKPIWQKISIGSYEMYDLSIPAQRQIWIMVKNSPYYTDIVNGVEQNPNFDAGVKTRYRAIDKQRESINLMKSIKIKRTAERIAIALADTPRELEDVALMCAIDPKSMLVETLWAEVYKFAQGKPEDFMKIYRSASKAELAVLKRGLLTGVLQHSLKEGYNFQGLSLGHSEEMAISFLVDHPQTVAAIDALSRQKDKGTLESTPSTKNTVTELNAKELALEKENRELKAQLAAASGAKVEELSGAILDNIDPEFAELLKIAKQLDVKGCHKIKDKEKLRAKVEEKKKLKSS